MIVIRVKNDKRSKMIKMVAQETNKTLSEVMPPFH